jgi:hypothetical protein
MNLVPARRKLNAEFGANYTASAVGWITGNSDFH